MQIECGFQFREAETRALLRAMESSVAEVEIECFVTLKSGPEDITALTRYCGQDDEDGGKILWRYSGKTNEGEEMKKIVKSEEELWYWPQDQGEYKGETILDKKQRGKSEDEPWHWPQDKEYKGERICFWH